MDISYIIFWHDLTEKGEKRLKNSDFRVSPPGSSGDTIISYILGILGGIFIILSVIKSIISRGTVERIYGVLMISAFLMAFTGIVFGVIGYHAEGIFFMKGI